MKLNLSITFRSVIALIIVLGFATFLSPANSTPTSIKVNKDIKIETEKQHSDVVKGITSEVLHGEILFERF